MQPSDPIDAHYRLLSSQRLALKKLGISTVSDLLFHLPTRYIESGGVARIATLEENVHASIFGEVIKAETKKTFRGRMPAAEIHIRDGSGTLRAIWFRQPYLAKMHPVGTRVRLDGVVKYRGKTITMANPHIEKVSELPGDVGETLFGSASSHPTFYPIYPETRGITSKWFYHAIERAFSRGILETVIDTVPEEILLRYHLPKLSTALVWIHRPKEGSHEASARKRFAFQEIFLIQLGRHQARMSYQEHASYIIPNAAISAHEFSKTLLFSLTSAQETALKTISSDLTLPKPMLRLLEGDVGSGKTAVAAAVSAAVVAQRPKGQPLQVAYMCPTEILAEQQFRSFITNFQHHQIQIGLLTGSGAWKFPSKVSPEGITKVSRSQLLRWVLQGEMPILIGTHTLIQKSVIWKNLALVIIDEQHRFGTAQRGKLIQKNGIAPHVLSMTATPIPRTLALTIYGDLDLSIIDTMPPGRKPIITTIISPMARKKTEQFIAEKLKEGRQMYVICPRIDEPDPNKELTLQAKSVKQELERLKTHVFPTSRIAMLHSKMKPTEKQEIMDRFSKGTIDILVSTSVVEVGVNVPNATIIVIEGAERFGLAQLHQLRGRVLRGTHQAHCFLYTEAKTEKTSERLKAVVEARNGFELAERDLALRGSGGLGGEKQWGISDIGMDAIRNLKMVAAAREEAERILRSDRTLVHHPELNHLLQKRMVGLHLE